MYKVVEVSDATLKKDIADYKKIQRKRFSLSIYLKREKIEARSDEILTSFIKGELVLKPKQYALFAQYIATFTQKENNEYMDKLQKMADFDVYETANMSLRTWWQKLLNIKPETIKYLSGKELEKKITKYKNLQKKLYKSAYSKTWLFFHTERMEEEARAYITAYIDGKIIISAADVDTFRHYIRVMINPIVKGTPEEIVLNKLKEIKVNSKVNNKPKTAKVVKMPLFERIRKATSANMVKLKENSKNLGKVAAIAALFLPAFSLFGLRGDSEAKTVTSMKNLSKKEIKKTTTQNKDEKTINFMEVANFTSSKTWTPPVLNQVEAKKQEETVKTVEYDSKRLARINHHNHVLEMRIGKKAREKCYEQIKKQINNGIFTLPDSLGKEDFAYAMEMYKAYAVESSLAKSLESNQKLSAEQNQKITNDILAAGETGLGVKKMAATVYKGQLTHNSVYDHASKKSQKQHNMNMKQWLKAKKQYSKNA